MASPYFSICIPTHNRAQYFPELVASVLSQDFTDWELIIVDNASDLQTRSLLCSLPKDVRIRIVLEEKFASMSNNFNRCIPLCNGQIFMLLTDKDCLAAGALRILHDFFQNNNCDFAYFNYCAYDEQGRLIFSKKNGPFYFASQKTWGSAEFLAHCKKHALMLTTIGLNVALRLGFMRSNRLQYGDHFRNDVFLFLEAAQKASRVCFLPSSLVKLRSISSYSYKREPDVLRRVQEDYKQLRELLLLPFDEATFFAWLDEEDGLLCATNFPARLILFLSSCRFILKDARLLEVKMHQALFFVQKYVLAKFQKEPTS